MPLTRRHQAFVDAVDKDLLFVLTASVLLKAIEAGCGSVASAASSDMSCDEQACWFGHIDERLQTPLSSSEAIAPQAIAFKAVGNSRD
jgi:hypothetical protein